MNDKQSFCFFFFFSREGGQPRLQGDWSSDVCSSDLPFGSLASKSSCPAELNSENRPVIPQSVIVSPLPRPWAPPSAPAESPPGCSTDRTTLAVIAVSSWLTQITRECGSTALPSDWLSKMRIVFESTAIASCWKANGRPGPSAKSLFLPPSRHMMAPVVRLSLKTVHVNRDEMSRLPSESGFTELRWK